MALHPPHLIYTRAAPNTKIPFNTRILICMVRLISLIGERQLSNTLICVNDAKRWSEGGSRWLPFLPSPCVWSRGPLPNPAPVTTEGESKFGSLSDARQSDQNRVEFDRVSFEESVSSDCHLEDGLGNPCSGFSREDRRLSCRLGRQ